MVEFAIVVPLLLLLVIGIIEISYGYYHLNILNKSVQDGARYFSHTEIARFNGSTASVNYPINLSNTSNASGGNAPYILNMKNLVTYGNTLGTGNALMPPDNGTGYVFPTTPVNYLSSPTTDHIQLTVQYTHNFLLGVVASKFITGLGSTGSTSITLTASSVLRVE